MQIKIIKKNEFIQIAESRFGPNSKNWKFICPKCKTIQSRQDFIDNGIEETIAQNQIGFSCIGRHIKEKGCNWTLGGLFQIHTLEIDDNGELHPFFELAEK